MTESPRILTIMGSGETSPTMVKTHRANIASLGKKLPLCVILDTPFGFQRNADDISAKAIEYFRVSLNVESEMASFRSNRLETLDQERFFSRLGQADFIFAGPGSPTYALKQWKGTPVPKILTTKLSKGPVVITFSSAAALTLGSHTVPVYEIYKVGEDPDWVDGLDILGGFGIKGAVIPHFNNTEGGNHDTRFCYLGEDRLELMESKLKPDESIFGIDEHTAITIDLASGKVSVTGNGTFNIRNQGRQVSFESGSVLTIDSLVEPETLFGGNEATRPKYMQSEGPEDLQGQRVIHQGTSPFVAAVDELKRVFDKALDQKDTDAATDAVLSLQQEIDRWQTETFQSDEMDQAKSALRSMIVRLGQLAEKGATEPEDIFAPFVDLVLELRSNARGAKRWGESDQIRNALANLGIEVRDIPGGSEWISIGKK